MPIYDPRNVLHIGPPQRAGDPEVTQAMADAVRQRVRDVGGQLPVWAILHEDRYESPPYADDDDDDVDLGLSLCGLALNSVDAERLAALGPKEEFSRWIVKGYRLGLVDDLPAIINPGAAMDGFTINELVAILAELAPGQTASKLCTGTGRRKDGPFVSLPDK
jgi:hypothetical protein